MSFLCRMAGWIVNDGARISDMELEMEFIGMWCDTTKPYVTFQVVDKQTKKTNYSMIMGMTQVGECIYPPACFTAKCGTGWSVTKPRRC